MTEAAATDHAVRHSAEDRLAFRCGGRTASGDWCRRAAGWGTDHKGLHRCKHHEGDPNGEGLPLWVGEIPRQEWARMTGANLHQDPETGRLEPSHGSRKYLEKTWFELLCDQLPDDDVQALKAAETSYREVANTQIRYLQMCLIRVERTRRRLRSRLQTDQLDSEERSLYALELDRAGSTALEISKRLHDWMSLKAKYKELAQDKDHRDKLRTMLAGLTDNEFAQIRKQPSRIADFGIRTPRFD